MGEPITSLALPVAASATPWRVEPAVTALFRGAGVEGTFVLLDERRGELRGPAAGGGDHPGGCR